MLIHLLENQIQVNAGQVLDCGGSAPANIKGWTYI